MNGSRLSKPALALASFSGSRPLTRPDFSGSIPAGVRKHVVAATGYIMVLGAGTDRATAVPAIV